MSDWVSDNIDKAEGLARKGLCDRCLGRMFGKEETGMTNETRGIMLRDALRESGNDIAADDLCPLCGNIFDLLPRFAETVAESVSSVESDNFLVGTRVDPLIAKMEKDLVAEFGLEHSEAIKSELNREIGKLAGPMIDRPVEFESPQVVACIDTRFADVEMDIKP